jgi:hypothetical protein
MKTDQEKPKSDKIITPPENINIKVFYEHYFIIYYL